ncbi:MAG: hypothetical protein JWR52_3360 [Marmoricola sp.]|nr:hypothetical protein [Marmoricola sp.]
MRTRRGRGQQLDRGETLVEILVSIAILGIAAIAILVGLQLAIKASDIQRKETTGGAYVRNYAEALENYVAAANSNYVACASTATYGPSTVGFSAPSGYTASVLSVQSVSATGALSTCTTDTGVEAVTLSVASSDNKANEKLMVLIRKACVGTGASPCS